MTTSDAARLVAICGGRTKSLDIHGQAVTTAYLKSKLKGPQQILETGLEGNDVAVHTDHIYAFSCDNYDHWAKELGREASEWPAGYFAETFLLDRFDEDDVRVGDRYAVGERVVLSVAGPRIPCFKLCWRLGQPDTFIRTFALSGRTGVYFNVESTGTVVTGDQVKLLSRSDGVRIHDIAAIAFGAREARKSELQRILDSPDLSDISRLVLRNKLYMLDDQQRTGVGRWKGWRAFTVAATTQETSEIKSFTLVPADGGELAQYRGGQFLTVRMDAASVLANELIRVWSISNYQDQPDHYRLSIKREPDGLGSAYMHDQALVGTNVWLKPPMGRFVLDRGSFKPVILIAGGIGITPLLSMARAHLTRGDDRPPLYLLHCCRNRRAQPFREQLDELGTHDGITVMHVYSAPNGDDRQGIDYDLSGFLTVEAIEKITADARISIGHKTIKMPWFDSDVYICGPPVFQDKLVAEMIKHGGNKDRIFTESFSAVGKKGESLLLDSAVVEFSRSNRLLEWSVEDDLTLLELAEAAGMSLNNSCRMGVCMSCSAALLEGAVHYDYQLTHEPDEGQVLLCSAKPASKKLRIDL